jgi:crossover junction endodeoxyribonuclease RuvC
VSEVAHLILGIDPGLALLGYGVVGFTAGKLQHVAHGCIRTLHGEAETWRLRQLYDALVKLRASYPITDVAMESLFYSRNVSTAISVGQARGVALVATVDDTVAFREYTPTEVKQVVAGFGGARKRQMQETIGLLLDLSSLPAPDDAADALAIAICHSRHLELDRLIAAASQTPQLR